MLKIDTPEQIIDELTYSCYRDNRATNPEVRPEQWTDVFGAIPIQRYELRYQMERAARLAVRS